MTHPLNSSHARELIKAAKTGDRDAMGELLGAYRSYLRAITEAEIDGALKARVDSSDIVQQTCLSAIQKIGDLDGSNQGQFVAWLKRIHLRNVQDAIRHNRGTEKRSISKEQQLQNSSSAPREPPHPLGDTPSQNAIRRESTDELKTALARLPEDQREVVQLRCFEVWEFQRISEHLDRTHDAVASLLKRGLRNLRKYYNTIDPEG
ncbi:MAG: sigma-70 family RNA polymerase sigma factor [Planctomycetes bacterium]|nr:sigma-70 family RNA polymerase sigma factor [Planctomycetota bacterium]